MFNETLRAGSRGTRLFLAVMGIVAATVALMSVLNAIGRVAGRVYIEYAAYLLMLAACYYIIRRQMTDYRYGIADGGLHFERIVGQSERGLETIGFGEIAAAGPAERFPGPVHLRATFKNKGGYAVVYNRGGQQRTVVFHPSAQFIELLEHELEAFKLEE